MPAGEVVVTAWVRIVLDQAFAEFTESIDRWWQRPRDEGGGTVVRFDDRRLVAVSTAGSRVIADVEAWAPPTRLELAWHGPHGEPGDRVVVEFEAESGGTRVRVRHRRAGLTPQASESAVVGLFWGDVARRFVHAHR